MSQIMLKAVRTGRKTFGDKVDEKVSTTSIAGVKGTLIEADTWSSGEFPGDGEYIRCTWLKVDTPDPWPNIKARF